MQDSATLSDALNATITTMNGNELILQNDMGNRRVDNAYLPAGYEDSQRSYPILYLLHPAGPRGTEPNQQAWIYYGEL